MIPAAIATLRLGAPFQAGAFAVSDLMGSTTTASAAYVRERHIQCLCGHACHPRIEAVIFTTERTRQGDGRRLDCGGGDGNGRCRSTFLGRQDSVSAQTRPCPEHQTRTIQEGKRARALRLPFHEPMTNAP